MVSDVNSDNFEQEVLKSNVPVVVDFWAVWCAPCKMFSPVVEEVSKDYKGKIKFCKLNTDENQKIAEKYSIMSIPTVLFFEDGEVKATSIGALSKEAFKKWIAQNTELK